MDFLPQICIKLKGSEITVNPFYPSSHQWQHSHAKTFEAYEESRQIDHCQWL